MYRSIVALGVSLSFSLYYGAYRHSLTLTALSPSQKPQNSTNSRTLTNGCPIYPPAPPLILVQGEAERRALSILNHATSIYISLPDIRRRAKELVEIDEAGEDETNAHTKHSGEAKRYVTSSDVLSALHLHFNNVR